MAKRQSARTRGEVATPAKMSRALAPTLQNLAIDTYLSPDGTPEIYIDGVASVVVLNGVAKFRCFSVGANPNDQSAATVVLRLAMALPALASVHELMGRLIHDLKISGVPPSASGT